MAALSLVNHFDNLENLYTYYQNKTRSLKSYMERQWAFVAHLSPKFEMMKLCMKSSKHFPQPNQSTLTVQTTAAPSLPAASKADSGGSPPP